MNKIIKKIILITLAVNLTSCNTFAGLLFPKKVFSFHPIGQQPPSSKIDRLKAGSEYTQTFTFYFSQAGNSFTAYFVPTIFINNPYKILHIKEMKYEWEGNTGVFLKDKNFDLPNFNIPSENGWYWIHGIGVFFKVNFEKVFKGKKPGDEFLFTLILVYSFDDEPENTQVLEYNVVTFKGEYISLFMGW
jgi:hypothetical protein